MSLNGSYTHLTYLPYMYGLQYILSYVQRSSHRMKNKVVYLRLSVCMYATWIMLRCVSNDAASSGGVDADSSNATIGEHVFRRSRRDLCTSGKQAPGASPRRDKRMLQGAFSGAGTQQGA